MPTPVNSSAAATLQGEIYVVGGLNGSATVSNVQIYDPTTNTWSAGVPLPGPLDDEAVAVVHDILYVIGGNSSRSGSPTLNAVWAYNPKTMKWSSRAAMPTARNVAATVVVNNVIYVIGGWNGVFSGNALTTVESYNPATNAWTEEQPLLVGKWAPAAGAFGSANSGYRILAPGGAEQCCPSNFSGDNENYNIYKNVWTSIPPDPVSRGYTGFGTINGRLYMAGGANTQGPALNVTEVYEPFLKSWKTLAPVPQATTASSSAVYKGKLYVFGGWNSWNGDELDNVQIYQP